MTLKYLLRPGHVKSEIDGELHFINSARLIELYKVRPDECIIEQPWMTEEFKSTLQVLAPNYAGDYTVTK